MAVTRAEMANRILQRCGALPFGQSADPNRTTAALQRYDEVYDYLKELEIVDWTSTGSVPNQYVPHVVALAALNLCDDISVPQNRYVRIRTDAQNAEGNIRRVYASRYKRDEVKVKDY